MTESFFSEPIISTEHLVLSIQNSTDKISEIKRISGPDFLKIRALVVSRAETILNKSSADPITLHEARTLFLASIDRLWNFTSRVPAVTFSCQLLQYYAVIYHDKMDKTAGVQDVIEFLDENTGKCCKWENNLLIMEFVLLQIYHELGQFPNLPLPQELQAKNNFILEQLNLFSKKIAQWGLDAPDNTFVHYLDCIYSFVVAKALDFQATKSGLLTEQESTFFIESKQYFLKKSVNCLNTIKNLTEFAASRGMLTPSGMEFSLGINVLIKLPIQEISTIEKNTPMMSCS
jgi:uncharacterized protein YkvS